MVCSVKIPNDSNMAELFLLIFVFILQFIPINDIPVYHINTVIRFHSFLLIYYFSLVLFIRLANDKVPMNDCIKLKSKVIFIRQNKAI